LVATFAAISEKVLDNRRPVAEKPPRHCSVSSLSFAASGHTHGASDRLGARPSLNPDTKCNSTPFIKGASPSAAPDP